MDDMKPLRALRADTPLPDAARLAAGRRRLLDGIAASEMRTARRGTRWAAAGVPGPARGPRRNSLVVLTATAVAGVLIATGVVMEGAGKPRPAGGTAAPATAASGSAAPDTPAARLLAAAASALAAAPPGKEPGAHQWLYARTISCQQQLCTTVDSWVRYGDGTRADIENPPDDGSLPKTIDEYPATTEFGMRPRIDRARLAALPTEPHALLQQISSEDLEWPFPAPASAKTPRYQFRKIMDTLAATQPTPPQYAAALYRAAALIPGIEIRAGHTKDAAGREGPALGLHGTGESLILDPATYAPRGENWDVQGSAPLLRTYALKAVGVVDNAGQRPGGPVPPPSSIVVHRPATKPGGAGSPSAPSSPHNFSD